LRVHSSRIRLNSLERGLLVQDQCQCTDGAGILERRNSNDLRVTQRSYNRHKLHQPVWFRSSRRGRTPSEPAYGQLVQLAKNADKELPTEISRIYVRDLSINACVYLSAYFSLF
jgi:hypothetical protein